MEEKKIKMAYVNSGNFDFPVQTWAKKNAGQLTAYGQWYDGKYEINYSSILTVLIQEAGRWCEYYASDLFIWWTCVMRERNVMEENVAKTFCFGMHASGIDNAKTVYERLTGSGWCSDPYYRAVWMVDVTKSGNVMQMELYKLDRMAIVDLPVVYTENIVVSRDMSDHIQILMSEEPGSEEECLEKVRPIIHSAQFKNGYKVNVMCCSNDYEKDGSNLAYAVAVLLDNNGQEILRTDTSSEYFRAWKMKDSEGNTYIVNVYRENDLS